MPQFDPLIFFHLSSYVLFSFGAVYTILLRWSFYNFIVSIKFIEKILLLFFTSTEKNWGLVLNLFRVMYSKM